MAEGNHCQLQSFRSTGHRSPANTEACDQDGNQRRYTVSVYLSDIYSSVRQYDDWRPSRRNIDNEGVEEEMMIEREMSSGYVHLPGSASVLIYLFNITVSSLGLPLSQSSASFASPPWNQRRIIHRNVVHL